ncbi:hypothetical protein DIU31_032785 [Mucilaginibacter rubeus]|uniref:Uncharacterized protein n=1 Tax=Mucilaginibacter rubeus TaxID=2027860 RepID=A0AAE6JL28_9SPHI|nr:MULTISPECIES: hypothetical protein [Mucilaginibacter]QEM08049.1 hypothetical protein DIU31_032785 [Mucilaginibacter rubeus]QEM20501.1 hypothetical protein DIU38_032390 [Mucilaginibacter gossypii]QTE42774.1 hypothetical protein J3L19_28260 [Mucilaginibacter rubeus]QTE49375.1 hypothetical protein J3L21_28220 [Mucilaginibacter rubeus]QTE54471.1 hypothetical protein J3L23_19845 [Mucilaginibacter rubeus]
MLDTTTIDEALNRGKFMIIYPIHAITVVTVAVSIYLKSVIGYSPIIILPTIIAGSVIAIIFRGFMTTRWRLWAFENVRNVHELEARAIKAGLIPNQNRQWFFPEFKSKADKARLEELSKKFALPDVFIDDYTVANEVRVYFSKRKNYLFAGAAVVVGLTTGIAVILNNPQQYVFVTMVFIAAGVIAFISLKKALNTIPRIIISDKGIETVNTPFYEWKDIYQEEVFTEQADRSVVTYFTYASPNGYEKLAIGNDLTHSAQQIESTLKLFRSRSDKAKTD